MKSYEKPTMEIVTFKQDIITASGDDDKICNKICDNICTTPDVCIKVCQEAFCAKAR